MLGSPGMMEAFATEIVSTGELNRLIKRRVADQADEVAIAGGDVFELVDVGRDLGEATLPTLRGW